MRVRALLKQFGLRFAELMVLLYRVPPSSWGMSATAPRR